MRVLLADPPQLFLEGAGQTRQVAPLGLGYVAAVLARDHDVRILLPDTQSYLGNEPWAELSRVIADEAPDVVGLTAVTATYPSAVRLAECVKSVDRNIPVVLGGVHATSEPDHALRGAPDIDYVVRGEGEQTLPELLDELTKPTGARLANVLGLSWRGRDGDIRHNPVRPSITDVDALPFPMRDNLIFTDDVHPALYQALVTLRGCPYRCIYCAVPTSNDRQTRYRSAESVADEVAHLRERYRVPYLFFHDSVFTLNRRRTVAICEALIERGLQIPFSCQTRADRVDPALLELMKAAGCAHVFFGIESGDAESLRRMRKRMALETVREAVGMVKALQMRVTGFFMVGFPWETAELMERTADFATDLDLDAVSLFSATPLPGTELWEMAGGSHMPDSIDFRRPQVNVTALSDDEYTRVYDRISGRIDAYNQAQMRRRAEALTALHGTGRLDRARVPLSWLD